MKCNITYICLVCLISLLFDQCTQKDDFPVLKGPYLGQKPPGMTPKIFAPGIVSTGFIEQFAYFTPNGKELYWLLRGAPHTVILFMKENKGRWTKPHVAHFSGKYFAKFCLSPDGNDIILTSNQPQNGWGEPTDVLTTWIVERTDTSWSAPKLIDSLQDAAAPTISLKGTLYFYLDVENERDIYMSKFVNGNYAKPVKLSDAINTEFDEVDPFIAPDESYIIYGASGPMGDGLYISFKSKDGSWIKAVNMSINTEIPSDANCPSVTFDSKYLFFTSSKSQYKNFSEIPITYKEKIRILNSPGNGNADIYWVDAKIIKSMIPLELK